MKGREAAARLPSLEDMDDTLRFMWLWFLDRLDEARRAGGGDLATDWNDAAVAMRLLDYIDARSAPQRFLELTIRGPRDAFRLTGGYATEPGLQASPETISWRLQGELDALCEWMLPWVALHIEQGGGYIDVDG